MSFDYEEWLDSVDEELVEVTTPKPGESGAKANKLTSSLVPSEDNDSYCSECDEYVRLIKDEGESNSVGHCPICGSKPGFEELGTLRGEQE